MQLFREEKGTGMPERRAAYGGREDSGEGEDQSNRKGGGEKERGGKVEGAWGRGMRERAGREW